MYDEEIASFYFKDIKCPKKLKKYDISICDECEYCLNITIANDVEVMGNIYQNKE